MKFIRQGATHKVVIGPFVDVTDGATMETGVTLAGADQAAAILHDNGTVVDISGYTWAAITGADGYYHLTLQSGITNTIGHLEIVVSDVSVCLPVTKDFTVLDPDAYDALFSSSPTLLTAADVGLLYESTVGTVNTQVSFDMDGALPTDDLHIGNTVTIMDAGDPSNVSTRWIEDLDQANDRIIINAAPEFTVAVGDTLRVSGPHPGYHAAQQLAAYDAATNDFVLGLIKLLARNDAAVVTDRADELNSINSDDGSGSGDYSPVSDALEAVDAGVNVSSMNGVAVIGAGTSGDKWRGA